MKEYHIGLYFRSILFYNILTLVLYLGITILKQSAITSGLLFVFGLFISFLLFLPYLLFFKEKLFTRTIIWYAPFLLSCLYLAYELYLLWTSAWGEMTFGERRSFIHPWHVKIAASMLVLVACWWSRRKWLKDTQQETAL